MSKKQCAIAPFKPPHRPSQTGIKKILETTANASLMLESSVQSYFTVTLFYICLYLLATFSVVSCEQRVIPGQHPAVVTLFLACPLMNDFECLLRQYFISVSSKTKSFPQKEHLSITIKR